MDFLTYAKRVIAELRQMQPQSTYRVNHLRAAYEVRLGILEAAQRLAEGARA